MIADGEEAIIMKNTSCADGLCGYIRPDSVAYHGFDGSSKLFLMELSMPYSSTSGSSNTDMPAVWMLNAMIPRAVQYGCNCQPSGCGEWDLLEVLAPNYDKCVSTYHGISSGGSPDFITRPADRTVKVAVVMDGDAAAGHIFQLPDDFNFSSSLDAAHLQGLTTSRAQAGSAGIYAGRVG